MAKKTANDSGLVYSTEHGGKCPACGRERRKCSCRQQKPAAKGDGIVRISRETKGRKGSGVTLITGLPLAGEALLALARRLKQLCGSGGTVKNGVIEIQGDQRAILLEALKKEGYQAKLAGG
ncbi:translation initiation factor Sui1 [Thiovibrio sp. JS02]